MAWERSFEARVLKIRENELKYQRLNYIIEVRTLYPIPSSFIDLTFNISPVDAFQQYLVCPMSHHVPFPCPTPGHRHRCLERVGRMYFTLYSRLFCFVLLKERVAAARDPCVVLALHRHPRADAHAVHRFHFGAPVLFLSYLSIRLTENFAFCTRSQVRIVLRFESLRMGDS